MQFDQLGRRKFITLSVAQRLATRAQQVAGIPRVGILRVAGPVTQPAVEELRQGLRALG